MSEKDDEATKSTEQKVCTKKYGHVVPNIQITGADDFIAQCREFLDKDKLAVPGGVDKSSGSDILLSSLTYRDFYNIHEKLLEAWKTIKLENTKVLPTLNPPKTWPPQHNQDIDEETLDSFEDAKAKFDVEAYSQMADRPVSPDLIDLYNSEIRVFNAIQMEMSPKARGVKAAGDLVPKLVFRVNNMTQEEMDKLNRETTPLTLVLKKSATLELAVRLFEWSQEDLKKRAGEIKVSPNVSSASSDPTLALRLPPNLSRLRDFNCWLLSQLKKLYDLLAPEKSFESDDTNTSSRDTRDSEVNQGSNPHKDLTPNPYSDDTLSEITPISTDSESVSGKDNKGAKAEIEDSSTPETTIDSTNSSSGPKHKRQKSPDDTVSSPKRQTV